ncbi:MULTISPECIES: beta strand repeat-containing protein [Leptolyngbya]|uniref:beta strand repeat-containing protein n=1 Tax=Leptolyngbya TaxID=47251 RepID=UPI00168782D5|nr:S-layer family protein [Leptolyngbya sp. FACHB-1624]MBD1854494.1 S-layer family protein [Leptolyngbya sp. FACHB-1624]
MKRAMLTLGWLCRSMVALLGETIVETARVQAQVIPDGTLPTAVTTPNNLDFMIDGGTRSGNNLFHSFSQLSIPTGGSALFNNATDVQTIFARVTGGGASNIDGLLKANGTASLFLLNPNGILFGVNAQLNIGGSFIGTTGNSIQFADGTEFSAVKPSSLPLLTMSAPIGVQFGATSSSIRVQGQGHNLLHPPTFTSSVTRDPNLAGLKVPPGQKLVLLGNGVFLDGGVLIAESGQLELGSVSTGTIKLNTATPNWEFNYNAVPSFSDIALTRAALIDASGNPSGSIHLQGKGIRIQESSAVFIQHQGQQAAGRIKVDADVLEINGFLPKKDQSLILSENIGSSHGADIDVSARQVVTRDGSAIFSTTYKNGGSGGNIVVNATDSILASGFAAFDPSRAGGVLTRTYIGGGRSGNTTVTTSNLSVREGAGITSLVLGGARGGNVQVSADTISLFGENSGTAGGSNIVSTTLFGGDAGSILIDTKQLSLGASGLISASTSGAGNAGSLTVHASEFIDIDGSGSVVSQRSRITASGQLLPPTFRRIYGLPALPTGNGGNLAITSPNIRVRNQGYIAAENVGSGDAGRLQIQANSIELDNQGQIRTATAVGNGGNLEITTRDLLLMRHQSLISARASQFGNGGNIILNAPIAVGLENSDIVANAEKGRGGNIQITTQGMIGLQYRDRLTPENDITASSEFGVNGTVEVNNVGVDPNSGLVELSTTLIDSNQQVTAACSGTQGSSFVITGRGGIPQNPTQNVPHDRAWNDMRDLSAFHKPAIAPVPTQTAMLVEATTWYRHPQTGKVELVAAQPAKTSSTVTCAAKY